ncbi:hypothetical protein ACQ5SO_10685 [Rhodovulum sp. DZ06]|uniref:hypothetical protein n=1 Tax=Rhodovulum sp. DZ06 TaxID=3425126 RepID=UPI003D352901
MSGGDKPGCGHGRAHDHDHDHGHDHGHEHGHDPLAAPWAWTGLAHLRPRGPNQLLDPGEGAFAQVVAMGDEADFRAALDAELAEDGRLAQMTLVALDNVMPLMDGHLAQWPQEAAGIIDETDAEDPFCIALFHVYHDDA